MNIGLVGRKIGMTRIFTDDGAGTFGGFHDLNGRLVDQLVIEGFETNTDFLVLHMLTR